MTLVQLLESPAVGLLLDLERDSFRVEVTEADTIRVSPADKLDSDRLEAIRRDKSDLLALVRLCDDGVQERLIAYRTQLADALPPTSLKARCDARGDRWRGLPAAIQRRTSDSECCSPHPLRMTLSSSCVPDLERDIPRGDRGGHDSGLAGSGDRLEAMSGDDGVQERLIADAACQPCRRAFPSMACSPPPGSSCGDALPPPERRTVTCTRTDWSSIQVELRERYGRCWRCLFAFRVAVGADLPVAVANARDREAVESAASTTSGTPPAARQSLLALLPSGRSNGGGDDD